LPKSHRGRATVEQIVFPEPAVCKKRVLCIDEYGQYRLAQWLITYNSVLDVACLNVSQVARDSVLKEAWNETSPATEVLFYEDKNHKLSDLLKQSTPC
jgi:hypothetical protein